VLAWVTLVTGKTEAQAVFSCIGSGESPPGWHGSDQVALDHDFHRDEDLSEAHLESNTEREP
jgi:hypothetical protein